MDTIVGVATPPGTGGVAIIRISGELSKTILEKVFSKNVSFLHGKMYYGEIVHNNEVIDEVYAVMFYPPYSFTGEQVCEIHCHGSVVGVSLIMDILCENKARPSLPGEFTKRAFLNGKLDLTKAEAVSDFIFATSKQSAKAAARQLKGVLKEKTERFQDIVKDLLAQTYAAIEYPEEDLESEISQDILGDITKLKGEILALADTFSSGRLIKNGIECVLAGKPNVGKSSLLNALCGFERAIVSHISGTTRDTVQHSFDINGVLVNVTDTAGIRQTCDSIEKQGVVRSINAVNEADIVLFICDAASGVEQDDLDILKNISCENIIYVLNKCDVLAEHHATKINGADFLQVSAKTCDGILKLKEKIYNLLINRDVGSEVVVTALRHKDLLIKTATHLDEAINAINDGLDMDCITIDLDGAWLSLGEITGNTVSEDIIDRIFQRFCLGK